MLKEQTSCSLLTAFAVAAFCFLSIALVVNIYRINYFPAVRTGWSEVVDFYIQGWNLIETPSSRFFFLTDQGVNDPHSLQNSNVYTHAPNSHRLIAAILVAVGIVGIQILLIAGCILGIIAIAVAFWAFVNRCQAPLVAYAILLFIVIDYSTFDQLLNPYRTWHYSLFFFVLSSILVIDEDNWRRYFVCGLASFLLFQYEYIFALFLFIACSFVILTGKEPLAHKKRLALSFSVGAAASILVFLAQLLAFFGSGHKLIAEVLDTWQARNTLWLGRPNLDSTPITTSDLIKIFSWTPAAEFRLPSGFLRLSLR